MVKVLLGTNAGLNADRAPGSRSMSSATRPRAISPSEADLVAEVQAT
jgi:hypothetical protein